MQLLGAKAKSEVVSFPKKVERGTWGRGRGGIHLKLTRHSGKGRHSTPLSQPMAQVRGRDNVASSTSQRFQDCHFTRTAIPFPNARTSFRKIHRKMQPRNSHIRNRGQGGVGKSDGRKQRRARRTFIRKLQLLDVCSYWLQTFIREKTVKGKGQRTD